ncbi:uncharacterized protein LOC130407959 isoform X1 [Triplophysa dalaica]|uniref:uncharacterized protein LOC130407959 isoform X1 n=1 Tax=Triplophysa dalaica TaxID=1582913 RepID=UPI0024DFD240|nr:uncharacterized protein LOC130407959 isoform X1 [Triplophysa dalaica]
MIKPKDNIFNEQNQRLKFGLLNIRSLNPKAVIVNEMITDNSFDILCLTETWLKPNDYFGLNESTPPCYGYIHEPRPVGRGGGVATIFRDFLTVTRRTMHTFKSSEMLALNITVPNKSKKSLVSLTLVTVYRPPGPYTNFLIEFADFLSDLLVNVDKVLIVGDFNIHVDSANDPLAVAFKELLDSCGVTQYINRPTHRLNHTLDLIISHGADLTNIDIIPQSDDVSDHHLIICTLRTAEISCISRYRQGRTITSTTKDSFVKNLPDLTSLITFPTNIKLLDDMTSNMGTIFSNTLEAVAPMKSKRINEKNIAPWYNNTTRALKRETRKLERKWKQTSEKNHSTETALVRITNDLLIASDKGNISLLVLLDLSAAFDTVDHKILLDRLHHYIGIQVQALQWFRSYLTDRYQYVHLNGKSSNLTQVNYGLPQGSVLGPLLFSIYMLPLGNIIRKHGISFHCYADDTQLYISSRPDDSFKLSKLAECIEDIKHWMTSNFLLLNSSKTEILLIAPKLSKPNISDYSLQIESCTVTPTNTVKDLGVILDGNLSFKNHISNITKTAFFHLRNVAKLRNSLCVADADAEKLIHAFVTSRLDYCNALLSGCPVSSINKLQLVQNAAARVLTRSRKYDHITPVLSSLHWLPIKYRIDFKIILITYKALNGLAPTYLTELLSRYNPSRSLRSQNLGLLTIPRITKSTKGGRAFSYVAPKLWNSLPDTIRGSDTLSQFKSRLKTHLFSQAFT